MKRRRVRPEDALRYLDLALGEPLGSARRQQRLETALLVYGVSMWPQATTGDRRRGRARISDADAVAAMQKLSRDTGEKRHFTLARLVAPTQPNGNATDSYVIRRRVRAYRKASATDK